MSTLKEDLRKTIPTLQRNSILMHVHLSSQKYLLHVQDCMAFMILCTATYITEFFLNCINYRRYRECVQGGDKENTGGDRDRRGMFIRTREFKSQ